MKKETLTSHPLTVSAVIKMAACCLCQAHLRSPLFQAWNDLTSQHSMRAPFWPSAIQVSKTLTIWNYDGGVIYYFSLCCYLGSDNRPVFHDKRPGMLFSVLSDFLSLYEENCSWSLLSKEGVYVTAHDSMVFIVLFKPAFCWLLRGCFHVCGVCSALDQHKQPQLPALLSLEFKYLLQNI